MPKTERIGVTSHRVLNFIDDGFIKIENAFSTHLAEQCRDELWADIGLSPHERESWTQPVIRVGSKTSPPFIEAANTPILHEAYDQLAGDRRWIAPNALGTFPVRFPSPESPGDDGWHVDMSFGFDNPDFMQWRVNVKSSGRALLMLFLFSGVGPEDAPRRYGKVRTPPSPGSCCPMAMQAQRWSRSLPTVTLLRKIATLNWQSVRQGPFISAIHSWFTPRNLTGGSARVSWHSRRCCQQASSTRRCHPRRFRSPSVGLVV